MPALSKGASDPHVGDLAELAALPGLGIRSASALHAAGIVSVAELRTLGAVEAFLRVRAAGGRPSLNLLWALEGALTGLSWQVVARTERTRLLFELDDRSRASARRLP